VSGSFGSALAPYGGNVLVGDDLNGNGVAAVGMVDLLDGASGAVLQTITNPNPGSTATGTCWESQFTTAESSLFDPLVGGGLRQSG
jgi:hypothetical protein